MALSPGVPISSHTPLLGFEDYLEQVNSASGSGATLADTYSTNVTVATAAPSTTHVWRYVVGVVLVLILIAVLIRLRRTHAHTDSPEDAPGAGV